MQSKVIVISAEMLELEMERTQAAMIADQYLAMREVLAEAQEKAPPEIAKELLEIERQQAATIAAEYLAMQKAVAKVQEKAPPGVAALLDRKTMNVRMAAILKEHEQKTL
jgi:hypothetical protein